MVTSTENETNEEMEQKITAQVEVRLLTITLLFQCISSLSSLIYSTTLTT